VEDGHERQRGIPNLKTSLGPGQPFALVLGDGWVEGFWGNRFKVQAVTAAKDARDRYSTTGEAMVKMDLPRRTQLVPWGATLVLEKTIRGSEKLLQNELSVCPGGGTVGGEALDFGGEGLLELLQGWA